MKSIPYFSVLTPDERAFLTSQATAQQYNAQQTIFLEGETPTGLWIVEKGIVKVYRIAANGDEYVLHLCGSCSTFNDIAAIDGNKNAATACALSSEVRVWLIPIECTQKLMLGNSSVLTALLKHLTQRVRSLVGQIEDVALYSVIVRLARFLLKQQVDRNLNDPSITRIAIAAYIHTTPQTLTNTLHELQKAGAIQFNRQRITIVNNAILESIALLS
jgi:CRP/FNR family transcriptional regulator